MSLIRSSLKTILLAKTLNSLTTNAAKQGRNVHRWVAPTLRELKKRADKLNIQNQPNPRSGFIEWNYRAELFAFGKRLNEEFQMPLLQTAFTHRSYIAQEEERQRKLGIEEIDIILTDNAKLIEKGSQLLDEYVQAFLRHSLPLVPADGIQAFSNWLQSTEQLAHIASHLGMKDLIFSIEYPPSEETLAHTLKAVIGALADSSGTQRSFLFVRDFVCTQLNQKDLTELWQIEKPMELLQQICEQQKQATPEARLIAECGKNTVLAAFEVGIYSNKQLLGKGFGEDIPTAVHTAALDVLMKFFGIGDNMRPFDFQLQVEPKSIKLSQS